MRYANHSVVIGNFIKNAISKRNILYKEHIIIHIKILKLMTGYKNQKVSKKYCQKNNTFHMLCSE